MPYLRQDGFIFVLVRSYHCSLMFETVIKLRIDTCSFYFVSPFSLSDPTQNQLSKPLSKVMRLVNCLMALFGPVSFTCKFVCAILKITILLLSKALYDLFRNLVSERLLFMSLPNSGLCVFFFQRHLGDDNRDCVMARFGSSQKWTFTQRHRTRSRLKISSSLQMFRHYIYVSIVPCHRRAHIRIKSRSPL